jgi:hypothetical protein
MTKELLYEYYNALTKEVKIHHTNPPMTANRGIISNTGNNNTSRFNDLPNTTHRVKYIISK